MHTWTAIINITKPRSLVGPICTSRKFRMVRLVAERIWPVVGCVVSCVSRRTDNVFRVNVARRDGGRGKSVVEGTRRALEGSRLAGCPRSAPEHRGSAAGAHRGSRCLGQGTSPKSCGQLSKKLKICGMKKSRSVLEKWPWTPTTAKAIPLK